MQKCSFNNIPDNFLKKWQEIADLLANIINVPAALIMKTEHEYVEVLVSSKSENNPYNIGDKEHWHGLYCETVIKSQKELHISNALKDKNWDKNPDIKLGMIAYLGFPINFPDKTPFGTICVLDNKERQFTADQKNIIQQFKNTIELDLALIFALELKKNGDQDEVIQNLLGNNDQYQQLHEEYLTANEELKQANHELKQAVIQTNRFSRLYEKSLNEIYIFNSINFQFIQANEAARKNLGYAQNELQQLTPVDLNPHFNISQFKELISPLLKGSKEKIVFETIHQRKDKSKYHVEVNLELMDFDTESVFVAFINDISVRKKAEEKIKINHDRMGFLMEATNTHFNILDVNYNILDVDSAWQKIYGDFRGRKCHEYFMGQKQPCDGCGVPKAFETKKTVVTEEFLSEENKHFQVHTIPFQNEHGEWLCAEFNIDITDRKKADEAIKSNLALLQIAGETAHFGGWSVDLEKNIATWSNAVADIHEVPHGYTPPVHKAINFYAPEWRDTITRVFNDCAQEGIPYDEEMEIITAKGKRRWVRASGRAVKDKTGKIVKVQGAFQDISEYKKAQEALLQSERKMRSIYSVAPTGIGLVVNRMLKEVNPRICEMTGYKREELINKNARILYPSQKEYEFVGKEKYEQIGQTSTGKVETLWKKKDGTIINVLLASTPIDINDYSKGVIFTALDITERKQAQEALHDSEEKYRALFNNAPLSYQSLDENGCFVDINPMWLRTLGYEKNEVIGKWFGDLLHPDYVDHFRKNFPAFKKRGYVSDVQFKIRRKDNTYIHVSFEGCIGYTSDGKFKQTYCVFKDITEQKVLEDKLKESEERFRHVLQDIPWIAVQGYQFDGTVIYWNKASENLYGYSAGEALGGSLFELIIPPEMRENVHSEVQQMHETLKPVPSAELSLVRKNGSRVSVISSHAIVQREGHEPELFCLDVDITDRKNVENALKKNELKFRQLFEQAAIGIFISQPDHSIIDVNEKALSVLGYTKEEMINMNAKDIVHPDDIQASPLDENVSKMLSGTVLQIERRYCRKDGKYINALINMGKIDTEESKNLHMVMFQDITGRKKAENLLQERNEKINVQNQEYEAINEELRQTNEELLEAKEKAEESDRLKTAFLQNMSHEIRTPLNAISGFTGMLDRPHLVDEKRQKFVSIIQNSSKQLVSIISDILTISSLDTKQEKLNISQVDINDVIQELLSIFEPEAKKQNVTLKAKPPLIDDKLLILTDKTKITQIFTNLLTNALKFTHQGYVEMSYNVKKDSDPAVIEFYVKDTGIGMTPAQQKIIFERFQQAHKSISKLYGGTGLGLSITKGFVALLGGEIWVESKPQEGSTFYFTIPYRVEM